MRTFAEERQAARQIRSDKTARPGQGQLGHSLEVSSKLQLQRTLGNQEVQRIFEANAADEKESMASEIQAHQDFSRSSLRASAGAVQAKLQVNAPADAYEQEAVRIAEQMMRRSEPETALARTSGGECPTSRTGEPELRRLSLKRVQEGNTGRTPAPPAVDDVLATPGQALHPTARAFMEPRFGHSFADVRVHADAAAGESAREIGALAYACKNHLVFAPGQYSPSSEPGRRLLAHELAHVVQQADGAEATVQRFDWGLHDVPGMAEWAEGRYKPWDESSARAECEGQIESWRADGYNFAANLMQYFIEKKGPAEYPTTTADIDEVKTHAGEKICDVIGDFVEERSDSPGEVPVTISHDGKGSDQSSNIRWWYLVSDKNMLYAYGGGDLNVNGLATVHGDSWSGTFQVSLGDEYAYESKSRLKTWLSAVWSRAYDAALWLERSNLGYQSFYHTARFTLTCTRRF